METIEVYVKGDAFTPSRFWSYALRTNFKQSSGARYYIDNGYIFSQKDTDEYKAMSENERKKIKFDFINGHVNYNME